MSSNDSNYSEELVEEWLQKEESETYNGPLAPSATARAIPNNASPFNL